MKKFILVLLTVVVATALTSKVSAQYSIPSYDVPVITNPTTFEETQTENVVGFKNIVLGFESGTREIRKFNVDAKDKNRATTAWAVIIIYSLGNTISSGPYSVYEGSTFETNLSTDYEWGVKVIDSSQDCELSVWFD